MAKYIYVGSQAELVGTPYVFSAFGQPAELDDSEITMLVKAGIHLIPEADFIAVQSEENPVSACWKAFDKFNEVLTTKEETIHNG
jgi:hypothetical protein